MTVPSEAKIGRSLSVKAGLLLAGVILIMASLSLTLRSPYAPASGLARAAQPPPPAPEPQPQPPSRKKQLPEYA